MGETIGVSIVVLAITFLSLILGELVPKRLALHSPERLATAVARPMSFISKIGAPVVAVLSACTNVVLSILGIKDAGEPTVTEDDVRGLLRQGTQIGVFEPMEQQIVERVLQFGDRRVSMIMTPRSDVVWLDLREDYVNWRDKVVHSPHSRFPVCDGDMDHVLRIVEAKDFLVVNDKSRMRAVFKPTVMVPEQTAALNVVEQLRQAKVHMVLVIDEYGGTVGVVTATDLLEALVGSLPSGASDRSAVQRPDGSWLLDGSLPIRDFKELLQLVELPGEGYGRFQTVAGFVIDNLGRIPSEGEMFTWEGYRFEVIDMDGNRIDKILVAPPIHRSGGHREAA